MDLLAAADHPDEIVPSETPTTVTAALVVRGYVSPKGRDGHNRITADGRDAACTGESRSIESRHGVTWALVEPGYYIACMREGR